MLKVKLLNDGGYGDMENVKFPVIVEGVSHTVYGCKVAGSELIRVGANVTGVWDADFKYFFRLGTACEVIDER